jgi:DNA-nicking Smr family endonuclease
LHFVSTASDENLAGYSGGIDSATFRRLRTGAIRPERTLDLHGLTRSEARSAFHREVAAAARTGARCLLVVHGRGFGSGGEPVLKRALRSWLGEAPSAASVLAFAPAVPAHGGAGATYLWLRKSRSTPRR